MKAKITALQELARDMVGDNRRPNVFFVSEEDRVVLVSTDLRAAYEFWRGYASQRVESTLEDRRTGVLASVEPAEDGSKRLVVHDGVREAGLFQR